MRWLQRTLHSNHSPNSYYVLKSDNSSGLAYFNAIDKSLDHVEKRSVYGIKPRNAEQAFAIHAILNPNVKLVSLTGVAGTGKRLLRLPPPRTTQGF